MKKLNLDLQINGKSTSLKEQLQKLVTSAQKSGRFARTSKGKSIPQTIEGITFPNLATLAAITGQSTDAVYKRYSRGARGVDLLSKKMLDSCNKSKEKKGKINAGGLHFTTAAAACRHFDIAYVTYYKRNKAGHSIEQSLGLEPFKDKRFGSIHSRGSCKSRVKDLIVFGKKYKTFAELARDYNMATHTVYQRIAISGYSPTEAVTLPGKRRPIEFNGIRYKSLTELAKAFNVSPETLSARLKTKTLSEALGFEIAATSRTIEFEGKNYSSLLKLAQENQITYGKLRSRLAKKMDLATALSETESIKNHGRYNKTILNRDQELAAKAASTYLVRLKVNNRTFFKIGITTLPVTDRLAAWSKFDPEIINVVEANLMQSYDLEQSIIQTFEHKRNKVIGAKSIEGYTEMLMLNDTELKEVISMMG